MISYIHLAILLVLLLGVITGHISPISATVYSLASQFIDKSVSKLKKNGWWKPNEDSEKR